MKWTTIRKIFYLYLHAKSFGLFGVKQGTTIYINFPQKKLSSATHYLDFYYPTIQDILYLDVTSPHLKITQHLSVWDYKDDNDNYDNNHVSNILYLKNIFQWAISYSTSVK